MSGALGKNQDGSTYRTHRRRMIGMLKGGRMIKAIENDETAEKFFAFHGSSVTEVLSTRIAESQHILKTV